MSLFAGTTTARFDDVIFQSMADLAQNALRGKSGNNTQAIVLHTEKGADYCSVIRDALSAERADERELLNQLTATGDTRVQYILCMWQNREVDLPSYAFRKLLLETDAENSNAEIFVFTENGYAAVKLGRTMK